MVFLSGLNVNFVFSLLTCNARRIKINREKAVYEEILFSQLSYKLNRLFKELFYIAVNVIELTTSAVQSLSKLNRQISQPANKLGMAIAIPSP